MPRLSSSTSQLTVSFSLLIVAIAVVLFLGSAYQIDEAEQVVITRFGKPVGQPINVDHKEAGLHFKLPLISTVNRFDTRILEWDGLPNQMTTRDKLYIVVDTFARWRISDPLLYFQALRDERSALSRLDDIIGSETRNVVARHDLIEVVRSEKDREPVRDETLEEFEFGTTVGVLPPINFGRIRLEQEIRDAAMPKVKLWGIELLDVRIKRINYKSDVITKIYERMISEREQIAERFRSEGAGEAAKIDGRREKDLREIQSQAYREVEEIQGKADAEASEIYANAYNTSPAAAEFYGFLKTLDMYREALGSDTTVVLTTDSDLFRLLKSAKMDRATNDSAENPAAP
ncbi:MAG: protease modulator HflC [Pirellulales bacterium]|jgi:membrane protease subunit HflC